MQIVILRLPTSFKLPKMTAARGLPKLRLRLADASSSIAIARDKQEMATVPSNRLVLINLI